MADIKSTLETINTDENFARQTKELNTLHRDTNSGRLLSSIQNLPKHINAVTDIGIAVRGARKSKGITQQNFADLAGVGRRFLSELESGKPTLEIGKVLQVATAAGLRLAIVNNSDE